MKQLKLSVILLVAAGLSFNSCKKKDKADEPASAEEVAQYKKDVESAGVKLINELDGLAETKAANTLAELDKIGTPVGGSSDAFAAILSTNPEMLTSSLKQSSSSIQSSFNEEVGIYTWNATKQDWDKTAASGKIVFKFPSTENGTANNAEMAISEFATVANPLTETADAPSKIAAYIKVDGSEVASYSFSASYNADGVPTNVTTSLTVETFNMSVTVSNSTSKFTEEFSFKNGSTNILTWNTTLTGEFTEAKIAEVENMSDISNISSIGDLLSSVEVMYQVFDIKLSLDLDSKALAAEVEKIASSEATQTEMQNKAIAAVNDNMTMLLAYEDGTEIATTEMVMVNNEPSMDFIFADDSRVAMDVYLENSMKEFEAALTAFEEDLEAKFN